MNKVLLFILVLLLAYSSIAQNAINLYGFANAPQTQMLNPAYNTRSQYHVTIPFLGSNLLSIETSGFSAYDLIGKNNISFQDKVKNVVYGLSNKDYITVNQRMEFFNIGQRINKNHYLSYGMYEEADTYASYPVEMMKLAFEGTSKLGKEYSFKGLEAEASLLMVYHVGLQKTINKDLQFGARLKMYNSAATFKIKSAKGSYRTEMVNNEIKHFINNIDIELRTTGFPYKYDEDDKRIKVEVIEKDSNGNEVIKKYYVLNTKDKDSLLTPGYIVKNSFIGGSKGVGIDLGFNYQTNKRLAISGSITDLGFIMDNKLTQTYNFKGSFETEGIASEFDIANPDNSFDTALIKQIKGEIPPLRNQIKHINLRPFKVHLMATYFFGGVRLNQCSYIKNSSSFEPEDRIGLLLYAQKRPGRLLYDASFFYEKRFTNGIFARANYTVNQYSASILGLSVSAQLGKLNLFAGVNNVLALTNLAKAKTITAQLGINIVLPNKR